MPTAPGFRTCSVRPQTAGLTWAEGVVPTPRGDIRVRRDRKDDGLAVKVAVPPTRVAEFAWGGTAKTVPAGEHG